MPYAARTDVSVERSRDEIERLLKKHGATAFAYDWEHDRAAISFVMANRRLRFEIPLPKRDAFTSVRPDARKRTAAQIDNGYQQAIRALHRALLLILKAKLEAIAAGVVGFEHEFLANIILPTGEAVGSWMRPQIGAAYASGRMPPALPAPDGG